MDVSKQLEIIKRGAVEIISEADLVEKLKKGRPLIVKAGFDPTAPDIHLGHTVLLRKLRHFQCLGHKVVFLIGDATALVGDPSGQSAVRKTMTYDEVDKNARTYEQQVGKSLNTKDKNLFVRRHNSEWFKTKPDTHAAPFGFEQFVELARRYTVARLLERDDFQKRLKENKPISFLELFYPLMQGYDSVKIAEKFGSCDVEIGGTDQKFNMLVGRDLQHAYGQELQVVITTPLLVGTDGVQKMSKSYGNYIGINEPAKEIFGKVMSISDELMYNYYELLTDEDMQKVKGMHPMEAKKNLAKLIVGQYHSKEEAVQQQEEFERAFREKEFPSDIILQRISADKFGPNFWEVPLTYLLADGLDMVSSRSEARRKIEEGAVEINGQRITNIAHEVSFGFEYKIRVGRKFARVFITK